MTSWHDFMKYDIKYNFSNSHTVTLQNHCVKSVMLKSIVEVLTKVL